MTSDERSPFVSVVIPTWDRAEFVSTCLGSLVEQDYPADRFEVIVVADGSTDGTQQVVDEIAAATRPPAIRFISKPHGGSNSARNLGIASSAGELICLVDDDQVAPKGWLTSMIAGVGMFPDAGCFGGPMRLRLEGRPPRACGREQLGESELDLGEEAVETEHVWGGNMTLRRAAFETAGPFREDLVQGGEETEWQDRARERGIKIVYLPEPFVWHRRTAEQLRLRRLVASHFSNGRGQALNAVRVRQGYSVRAAIGHVRSALWHALGSWCSAGLLVAARHSGRLVGLAEARLKRLWVQE